MSETQTFPTSSGEKKEGNPWQPQSFVGKNGRTDAIWQLRLHKSPLLPLAPLHLRKGHFLGEKRGHDTMKNGHKPSVFWKQPTSLGLNFFLKHHFDHFFAPYPGNYIQPGWRFQRSRKILSTPKDFHWKTLFLSCAAHSAACPRIAVSLRRLCRGRCDKTSASQEGQWLLLEILFTIQCLRLRPVFFPAFQGLRLLFPMDSY